MFTLLTLGGTVLTDETGPVTGRAVHRRRLALLAILATYRGRPVAREKLVGLLWAEHPGDAARHLLSESLYVLKKTLGDQTFTSVGDEVALNPNALESDVASFEAALESNEPGRAVVLYRGPFLDGFYLSAADEFNRWVESERDRLARLYAEALERLAGTEEIRENYLEASRWWRRLNAWDPYSSRVVLRLMSALEAGGEHAAALRAASEHADFLRADLGAEPDPAVPAYAERLRTAPAPGRLPPFATERKQALAGETDQVSETTFAGNNDAATEDQEDQDEAEAKRRPLPDQPARQIERMVDIAPIIVFAVLIALVLAVRPWGKSNNLDPSASPDPRRIAVLYLEDLSERRDQSHIVSGLTEALIHQLSQVAALHIVSANGVKPYRRRDVPFDSIVAALNVGSVVSGSVERANGFLRVRVGLVDAATGKQVDSRAVVLPDTNLLLLEDSIAAEVAGFLRRRLGHEIRLREWAAGTRNQQALELALRAEETRRSAADAARGRNSYDVASALRILARADSLLAEAREADPDWLEPVLTKGWVAIDRARLLQGDARRRQLEAAVLEALRVLALDTGNARAFELRGTARWRLSATLNDSARAATGVRDAEVSLRAAVNRDPNLASAWSTLTQLLLFTGAFGEADVTARRALAADAYLTGRSDILHALLYSALMRRSYTDAWEACDRGRSEFPQDWRFVECRLTLMREDLSRRPDPALAWRLVEQLERLDPSEKARTAGNPYSPTYRRLVAAAVSARAGDLGRARSEIARARREVAANPNLQSDMRYDEAYLRLLLGEHRSADSLLRIYVVEHPEMRTFILRDPLFQGLSPPAAETRGRK
jgi:DNA-binding SARP family transcriptional activator/TolB-like protein